MVIDVIQRAAALAQESATQGFLALLHNRHSTRGPFSPDRPVTTQQVKLILEAARWAPTPDNTFASRLGKRYFYPSEVFYLIPSSVNSITGRLAVCRRLGILKN